MSSWRSNTSSAWETLTWGSPTCLCALISASPHGWVNGHNSPDTDTVRTARGWAQCGRLRDRDPKRPGKQRGWLQGHLLSGKGWSLYRPERRCRRQKLLWHRESVLVARSCLILCAPLDYSLSMEFSRQEYWSGLPFPSAGDLPDAGIKPASPALQADFFTIWATKRDTEKRWQQNSWL